MCSSDLERDFSIMQTRRINAQTAFAFRELVQTSSCSLPPQAKPTKTNKPKQDAQYSTTHGNIARELGHYGHNDSSWRSLGLEPLRKEGTRPLTCAPESRARYTNHRPATQSEPCPSQAANMASKGVPGQAPESTAPAKNQKKHARARRKRQRQAQEEEACGRILVVPELCFSCS